MFELMKTLWFVFPCLLLFKVVRVVIFNLHNVGIYSVYDLYQYWKLKKWREFRMFGIDLFCGYFGNGKTLSVVQRALAIHERYGDSVKFISNIQLSIPYEPLVNFQQIVDLQQVSDTRQGTVVIIDEVQTLLSHRNYATFPMTLLNVICQPRKCNVYIMCTAQRFFMVDKIFRSLIKDVYDCRKTWRFQHCVAYDGWDYEQAVNTNLIQRKGHYWWFVKNKHYMAYDTTQQIDLSNTKDFLSNEEVLARLGDSDPNLTSVNKGTRKLKKMIGGK